MLANWLFWIVAAALAVLVLGLLLAPLLKGAARPERRSSYDMQVYRDQLREIDGDVARGVLSAAEAEAVRVEVSRRLLGAAEAEAREVGAGTAPRRATRLAVAGVVAALALGGGALYATIGAPGRHDLPHAMRLADIAAARANRPKQAEMEATANQTPPPAAEAPSPEDQALMDKLRAAVAARPDDVEGHKLLARSEAALGRWVEARTAQERAVSLLGDKATAGDYVDLAEFMVIAADGYVSPEAESALGRALELAPDDPVARYYSGLALLQGGRADLTYQLWSRLLQEGPPDAPWMEPIRMQIEEVSLLAGRQPPEVPFGAPSGPAAGPGAVASLPPGAAPSEAQDQAAMIQGMVDGLSQRLATEGGPPEDWAQLIRSLGVLGRVDEAGKIWREARDVFAADPEALALLRDTAAEAGVPE